MDLSVRIDQPELMDTVPVSERLMRETLAFLTLTNTHFGGSSLVIRHLDRWSKSWDRSKAIRLLDVGTGGGEIPKAIVAWAEKKGFQIHITAIDLVPDICAIARENTADCAAIDVQCADLFKLLEQNQTFDYVIASLFLHHMPPAEGTRVLKTFDQLSERGLIVSDLLRTRSSYWAVSALCWLFGNRIVRHDGPLSVRRAFLPTELDQLAREAGLSYLKAATEPWFRVSLAGEKR